MDATDRTTHLETRVTRLEARLRELIAPAEQPDGNPAGIAPENEAHIVREGNAVSFRIPDGLEDGASRHRALMLAAYIVRAAETIYDDNARPFRDYLAAVRR